MPATALVATAAVAPASAAVFAMRFVVPARPPTARPAVVKVVLVAVMGCSFGPAGPVPALTPGYERLPPERTPPRKFLPPLVSGPEPVGRDYPARVGGRVSGWRRPAPRSSSRAGT